jgi:hypothetical protein
MLVIPFELLDIHIFNEIDYLLGIPSDVSVAYTFTSMLLMEDMVLAVKKTTSG